MVFSFDQDINDKNFKISRNIKDSTEQNRINLRKQNTQSIFTSNI